MQRLWYDHNHLCLFIRGSYDTIKHVVIMDWELIWSHLNISSQPLGHFNAASPGLIWKLRTQDDNILRARRKVFNLFLLPRTKQKWHKM